jgi:hypothetical protein
MLPRRLDAVLDQKPARIGISRKQEIAHVLRRVRRRDPNFL